MRHKSKRKFNKSKFTRFVVIAATCLYVAWKLVFQQVEIIQTQKLLSSVDAEIAAQQQLQQELLQKEQMATTPEYIEKIAREQLNFAAPDEIVFVDATQKQ